MFLASNTLTPNMHSISLSIYIPNALSRENIFALSIFIARLLLPSFIEFWYQPVAFNPANGVNIIPPKLIN